MNPIKEAQKEQDDIFNIESEPWEPMKRELHARDRAILQSVVEMARQCYQGEDIDVRNRALEVFVDRLQANLE